MDYEIGTTEEYMVVSTRRKVGPDMAVDKAIQSNFEVMQKEFPKLNIKQTGPVILIYHFKPDSGGKRQGEYMLETAFPIGSGKLVSVDPRSKLAVRELKKVRCARYLFKGPVWETPWDELKRAVAEKEKKGIEETREIYRVFKGGGSSENETEMQVILK